MNKIAMPSRIARLPVDEKWKLPVPWFVQWIDGKPMFPVMDGRKWTKAVRDKRCWICGQPIQGGMFAFVIGPMCGINRTSAEPPCDVNCAIYAAQNCPFLITPKMKRMDVSKIDGAEDAPGIGLMRNPGCCGVWITKSYEVFSAGNGPLIELGEPRLVHWFAEGREATLAEVKESIDSGLPSLLKLAAKEGPNAIAELVRMTKNLERWLPKQ